MVRRHNLLVLAASALALFVTLQTAVMAAPVCRPEQEPNDSPELGTAVAAEFCIDGTMSSTDQEILVWTLDAEAAKHPWALHLDGPTGQQSKLQIYRLDEPGDASNPAVVGPELLTLATPLAAGSVDRANLFLAPGQWLIGLSSSSDSLAPYHISASIGEAPVATAATNTSAATATPLAAAFASSGVIAQTEAWYAWSLSAAEARKQWKLTASAPLGAPVGLALQTPDGKPLLSATRLSEGQLTLPDIGLPAGTYLVRLSADATGVFPFTASAVSSGPRSPLREDEPNDTPLTARPLALGQGMVGHISQSGDVDTFVLPLKETAGKLFSIEVGGDSKISKRLCIGDAEGALLQCRDGEAPSLVDIVISEKTRFVTVSGGASPDLSYTLTARASSESSPGVEAEPNDTAQQAQALASPALRGRFVGAETDNFGFTVDDANVRHFSVTGDAALSLEVLDSRGQSSAHVDRSIDASGQPVLGPLDLSGLTLAPGEYIVAINGKDGDYTLGDDRAASPPVSTDLAEIEPNDSSEEAEPILEGKLLTAQLGTPSDQDTFRISLANRQGIDFRLATEVNCPVRFQIGWDSALGEIPGFEPEAGQKAQYRALLEAGDYFVIVRPNGECAPTASYTIGYATIPNMPEVGDVEPNDIYSAARPVPPSLEISGTVGEFSDADWFRLPKVDVDTAVTLTATGIVNLSLTDGLPTSSSLAGAPTELAGGYAADPITAIIPAGRAAALRVSANRPGDYTLKIEMAGVTPAPAETVATTPLTMQLKLDETAIAAYWHRGQRVGGTLSLTNPAANAVTVTLSGAASRHGWSMVLPEKVSVEAGATTSVPVSVEIEPDPFATRAVQVALNARSGTTLLGMATADIAVDMAAAPVGDHLAFTLPDTLLGGFNVAWTALGGAIQPSDQMTADELPATINDGLGSSAGFQADAGRLPLAITIRFAGERAWPVRGVTINPQTTGMWPTEYLKGFELWLSADGQTFEKALSGEVSADPYEQAFVLPEAVQARAAQLRMLSNGNGNLGKVGFSEWKVITDPAVGIGAELDVADTARGGHIVWSQPLISEQTPVVRSVLEAGGDGPIGTGIAGIRPQFTVGFNEDRAAQITRLEWLDSASRDGASLFPAVEVEASTETPLGPWTSLGTWQIDRSTAGRASMAFDTPIWARFLRFSSTALLKDGENPQFPTELHVFERSTDGTYRSILGEWGEYSPDGYYEMSQPAPPAARIQTAEHQSRETAEPLAMAETASGRVELDKRQDWYKIVQPADRDLLAVTLGGEPNVGAQVTLWNEAGKALQLNEIGSGPRKASFEARVEAGATYYLQVTQPPHSIVIAYDTSGSLLSFIPMIANALEVFAAGVTPGHEAVNFLPFDSVPMLPNFTDQPRMLAQALAKDPRTSTSSGLETTTLTAMRALVERKGTRAILLVTDAASPMTAVLTEMWSMVDQTRPLIFAAHTGSFDDPLHEKQVLQDLSMADGGRYVSSRTQSELDVAFDRVATWLRRPASYTIVAEALTGTPPEPGALIVRQADATASANSETGAALPSGPANVEIVLDASGSMLARIDGKRKIEIAREALNRLVTEELKPGAPVALRVFGNDKPGSCETSLAQPLGPLDPAATSQLVNSIMPQNLARTPIAASLAEVGNDLASATGQKTVVLITDGEETCGGDPRAAIAALAASNINLRVNIVGFDVGDTAVKAEFAEWARIGGGRYFDAETPGDLDKAVTAATQVPFEVSDANGTIVGSGEVDGAAIDLPAGTYRVEIEQAPPRVFEGVVVREKLTTQLEAN
ncbi:MAG: VWA domain-containing protein [Devosia sp.]